MNPENPKAKGGAQGGAAQPGIAKLNVQYAAPMPQALGLIPEDVAKRYKVLPLALENNTLRIFMANPADVLTVENLSIYTRRRIEPIAASEADIKEGIDYNYRALKDASRLGGGNDMAVVPESTPSPRTAGVNKTPAASKSTAQAQVSGVAPLSQYDDRVLPPEITSDSPIAHQLDKMLDDAVRARASDIHIEPDDDKLRVRFRIDGILHEVASLPLTVHHGLISRIKILSDMNIADHRRPQDGQFSFDSNNKYIDVRVATVNTVNGEMAVLRLLDKSVAALALPQVGFLRESQEMFEQMLMMPYGMVLISGPTGAGKTTTLYAAVNSLDQVGKNIITVEDPVEYRFTNINQIQVNVKAGLTFASGLRAIVRLDPDVILVGEIRDSETALIAVQSALTGHLVLSSVHANDTVGAVFRLIDLGVEPFLISSALIGIVAQRMVRRVCPHCARKVTAPLVEQIAYEKEMGEARSEFMYGEGCKVCVYTGYLGRTAIFEILTISDNIRRMIVGGSGNTDIRAAALSEGLVPIARYGMMQAKAGITTPYEVLRNAYTIS
ncbi:MAG: type II/IV secretion system protein [Dehalococcoidia bacterium]|nr:type II/IV secretion system protein [Dehalococcoidia bacterium]